LRESRVNCAEIMKNNHKVDEVMTQRHPSGLNYALGLFKNDIVENGRIVDRIVVTVVFVDSLGKRDGNNTVPTSNHTSNNHSDVVCEQPPSVFEQKIIFD
jgi:hypothetical protein